MIHHQIYNALKISLEKWINVAWICLDYSCAKFIMLTKKSKYSQAEIEFTGKSWTVFFIVLPRSSEMLQLEEQKIVHYLNIS